MTILYVGAGAVNLCLAGWMHSFANKTMFLVRSTDHELIKAKSFQCRLPGDKNKRVYRCDAVADIALVERPDLVIIGVKTYSLESVIDTISTAYGKEIPVMSVLNGISHVELISTRFPNAIFATISFNAFRTSEISADAVGGALSLSTFSKDTALMDAIYNTLKKKIKVNLATNPTDAAHCKLVFNLCNAVLTMVGFHENRNRELDVLQRLMATVMWEGVTVIRSHGIKESKVAGMPPWFFLWLSKILSSFIMVPIFKDKMSSNVINSMAQDIQKGSESTELEEINGYLVALADRLKVEAPFNKALYQLFTEWVQSGARPIKPSELLSRIESFSNR